MRQRKTFRLIEDVIGEVETYIGSKDKSLDMKGIEKLEEYWRTYMETMSGTY